MSLSEEKSEARKRMKALLAAMDPEDAENRSLRAAGNFRILPEYVGSDIILAFLSKSGEILTENLILAALADGKKVAVPRMEYSPQEGHSIVFVPLRSNYRSWQRDRFDIPEPPADEQVLSDLELFSASIIVATPGLAFDRRGSRLGRGRGYYDRFLAHARASAAHYGGSVIACGLCYAFQVVDEVPCGENDSTVDLVVTEDGRL